MGYRMSNEPSSLRAHLLNVEPLDENRRQLLEQEIRAMSDNVLKPRYRKWWIIKPYRLNSFRRGAELFWPSLRI